MDFQLESNDQLTMDIVESGVVSWEDLIRCVKNFHYGRNANRSDVSLVWYERKGTCSSKHAFLKHVADLNHVPDVELVLCLYKMTAENTHGVGEVLRKYKVDYLPEAHCYIRFKNEGIDITTKHSDLAKITSDILEEQLIDPEQVSEFKVNYHKAYMQKWGEIHHPSLSFEELWTIREQCLSQMGIL